MRDALRTALVSQGAVADFVFLTGDLGFAALEPLRDVMGHRFVNAGVAEQNMVSVAAGMAREGLFAWTYSIAPFLYARAFEQIRNDVAHHRLPCVLVGNGGGYAYGVMGATHHALEDYGVLGTLPGLEILVPAFAADVELVVRDLFARRRPAYLRLGRCEAPRGLAIAPFAPWRRLLQGEAGDMIVVGPIAGALAAALVAADAARRPSLWVVGRLPLGRSELPSELLASLAAGSPLTVVEEHVGEGGLGSQLLLELAKRGVPPRGFRHHHARGYPSGRYGSQVFHRQESGLDPAVLAKEACHAL
jgi:transketolase